MSQTELAKLEEEASLQARVTRDVIDGAPMIRHAVSQTELVKLEEEASLQARVIRDDTDDES